MNPDKAKSQLRDQIIGLEEHALRKSYFPLLQQQVEALKATQHSLERKAEELESMRRRAEESEANYRELFDKSSEAIIVHDLQSLRILEVNQAFTALFGYAREEAVHLSPKDLAAPASHGMLDVMFGTESQAHSDIRYFELLARHKDRTEFWVGITLKYASVRGERRILTTVHDITDRRRAEAAVIEANRQLEEKVERRTHELARANQELSTLLEHLRNAQHQIVQGEKLAALGSLVAGVAHELNTPIGNSLMLASSLQDKREEFAAKIAAGLRRSDLLEFMEYLSEGIGSLLSSLNRAGELVASFKELAVDQTSSRRRKFNLHDIINETTMMQGPGLRRAGVSLHNEIPAGIMMDSYPGPLGQVIGNLLNNALKHGFEGRQRGVITISACVEGERAELVFADDGCGIKPEHLPRVFDPFFTTKLGQGGSGLGLHILYNLVTGALGGTVRLESTPGEGTRFFLSLPLIASKISEPE